MSVFSFVPPNRPGMRHFSEFSPRFTALPPHSRPSPQALSQPCRLHLPTSPLSVQSPRSYIYTNQLLHQPVFRQTLFYTKHFLQKPTLHQPVFTQTRFYTNSFFHKPPFTPTNSYTNEFFCTHQFLRKPIFRPTSFYTNRLLHQPTFTSQLSHKSVFTFFSQTRFYTNQFLDINYFLCKPPFAPIRFYNPASTRTTFSTNQPFIPTSFTQPLLWACRPKAKGQKACGMPNAVKYQNIRYISSDMMSCQSLWVFVSPPLER